MAESVETYRGSVKAWECDSFGHFTVAYYFARFAEASAAMLAALREKGLLAAGEAWRSSAFVARFERELRAGDGLHIFTSVAEQKAGLLGFAHRLVNSMSGESATSASETLSPGGFSDASAAAAPGENFMVGARDLVRADELDREGRLALAGYIHRCSASSVQLLGAAGITPDYLRANARGFATFEIRFALHGERPRAGARLEVESALGRLGASSLEMLHRVREAASGRLLASGSQSGAHFDLKSRRSTPIPPELRERAAKFVV